MHPRRRVVPSGRGRVHLGYLPSYPRVNALLQEHIAAGRHDFHGRWILVELVFL